MLVGCSYKLCARQQFNFVDLSTMSKAAGLNVYDVSVKCLYNAGLCIP